MIQIKQDVTGYCKTGCVRPQIWQAINITSLIFDEFNKACVITSLCEGRHSKNSKHYEGNAVDFRSRHLTPEEKLVITDKIKNELGNDYDVVIEKTHIHVEYDPKEVHEMNILSNFKRLKEKSTIVGIAGVLGSVLSIPAEYADPFEALIGIIISVLFITFGNDKSVNPKGGTIDPIPSKDGD